VSPLKQREQSQVHDTNLILHITTKSLHIIEACSYASYLPNVVVKCSCAFSVFAHLWFLMSQARNVLSSEQLSRYLPPGWNCKPRTQLSWPI